MIYLVNHLKHFDGRCTPILQNFMDNNGNNKFPTNISITNFQNKLITNIRLTDYAYIPVGSSDIVYFIQSSYDSNQTTSCNIIFDDKNRSVVYETNGDTNFNLNSVSFKGLEDIRLVTWNNILYGIGFRPDIIFGHVIPQLIEYNDDLSIKHSWVINTNKVMEKNWQPIEDMPFNFMYDSDTSKIISLDIKNLSMADDNNHPSIINEIDAPEFSSNLCGSSQIIKYGNGYLSICHTSHRWLATDGKIHWFYNHYLVKYDNNLNKIWVSKPFRFVDNCLEFCCGLTTINNGIYIGFSMYDGLVHILSYSMDGFNRLIEQLENNSEDLNGDPPISYLYECYKKSQSADSIGEIVYLFALEQAHMLDNTNRILEVLKKFNFSKRVLKGILLYFITRRSDTQPLLKKLNDLC